MPAKIYIANTGLLTAAGDSSLRSFFAYRAGVNTYQAANYHTPDHHQITLALVPDGALPPLAEHLEEADHLSYRDERLILMCHHAAAQALAAHRGDPVPLILAGPENYPGLDNQLPSNFLHTLKSQVELPVLYDASRTLCTGRTGVIEAIRLAQHYLHSGHYECVLVGGVDSCQNTPWLHLLDRDGRVKSDNPGSMGDNFAPGEGAGFLLLTNNPTLAMEDKGRRVLLSEPGFGDEPGHIYSDDPYRGSGLDSAVKSALANLPEHQQINYLFSSMNGEHYWAKEIGVAMTRSSQRLHENLKHEHPADCFGDLGAATGSTLITLATQLIFNNALAHNILITTSSDSAYRAAICLTQERISA